MEEDEVSDELIEGIIQMLLDEGSMEIVGYDNKSDQFTYKLTSKCAELRPELYRMHFSHVNEVAKDLWMEDVIDIVFNEGYTSVALTEEQYFNVKQNIDSFSDEKRMFLLSLISNYESDKR